MEEATAFLHKFADEVAPAGYSVGSRVSEARRALRQHGFYEHSPEELAFGAKVAWRNQANCIGRLHWKGLQVIDCRSVTHTDDVAGKLVDHLRRADCGGKINLVMSVFAPIHPNANVCWIESSQITRYAAYTMDNDTILGDPMNTEATRIAMQMGWAPPVLRSAFDKLPVIIRDPSGRRSLYAMPDDAVREVVIEHPSYPGLAELGLKWYAVPVVSDMIMTIGGVDYPCAPFNGYYMATEIASRNFLDLYRYNKASEVAQKMNFALGDPLNKDRISTELNAAVLYSFRKNGVTIIDHHEASDQFVLFAQQERSSGRILSGNWDWIVPPEAAATCPVFHMTMKDFHDVPNFYRASAVDGNILGVSYASDDLNRWQRRWQRFRRRIRSWYRQKF